MHKGCFDTSNMVQVIKTVFLLLILATCSDSWLLTATDTTVAKKMSTNLTIECRYDGNDNNSPKINYVQRIRISKFRPNNQWKTVAKIMDRSPEKPQKLLLDAEVSGKIGSTVQEAFLKIFFPVVTEEALGQFLCEVDGFGANDELVGTQTQPINIRERGVSLDDIMKLVLDLQTQEKNDQAFDLLKIQLLKKAVDYLDIKVKSNAKNNSLVVQELRDVSKTFLKFSEEIKDNQKKIFEQIKTIQQRTLTRSWPVGDYSILSTSNGCPYSNTFNWQKSSIKLSTVSGTNNKDEVSKPSHLRGNTLQKDDKNNHFVYLESCSKVDQSTGPAWPRGKYCLQSYNIAGPRECPVGFHRGWIELDTHSNKDTIVNMPHLFQNNDILYLYYCCRDDGDVKEPMLLPARDPFYLYRFGGECQEVMGMNVSKEWLKINTDGTKDMYGGKYHPDGRLSPVVMELCYYQPKY